MQPRLRIKILPRKPQIVFNISDQKPSLTNRQIPGFPNHRTSCIHDPLRRPQMIVQKRIPPGIIPVNLHSNRFTIQVNIIPDRIAASIRFTNQQAG